MLEETHYYPFGLTMAGISDKALKSNYVENKYKFNEGTDLANKEFSDGSGLELYETPFRSYDAQIGRFHQLDPLTDITENWSPYAYALDNPISYNDAWGLAADSAAPKTDHNTLATAYVSTKKKDCVTCDASTVKVAPPPSSVTAPIKGNASSAAIPIGLTMGTLGEGVGTGVTITGTASSGVLGLLLFSGAAAYGMTRTNPIPSINILTSDITLPRGLLPYLPGSIPHAPTITYPGEPWGEQYTLRALADGLYPVYQWGKGQVSVKQLHRGDIWKIGTTINGTDRYSNSF